MRTHDRTTYSHLKIPGSYITLAAAVTVCLATSLPMHAQAQSSVSKPLTDAQAAVLLQALVKGTTAPSAAQLQMLSQYLQRESQTAPAASAIDLTRAEMMLQTQSQSSGTVQTAEQKLAGTPTASATASATLQKKPGSVRIGVVEPKAQMGQGNSGMNVAEPLRAVTIQYLSGPAIDVIPIAAMMPTQIEAEVKEKQCDYVLYSSISQKMNSGGLGMFQKAMPLASMIPMVGAVGGMATMVAGSAAGAAMNGAASLTASVKAKSEVTYEYRLTTPGNSTPVVANSAKAKAKQDGEDIITPLIEQAAGAILAEVEKKK